MPSKSKLKLKKNSAVNASPRILFVTLVCISFLLWIFYRSLFNFSVLFDETIGKAIFFGLPILIYVNCLKDKQIFETIKPSKLFPGLLRGLAYGGMFGFVVVVASLLKSGRSIMAVPVFIVDEFWHEFFLALLTAFWESLFFFGFIQIIMGKVFKQIKSLDKIMLVGLIFLIFHLPNIILRFGGFDVSFLILLLYLFGMGQAIIFEKERNIYTIMMTHAIWGLALMIHL
jgi:hypothetical protein